MTLTSAAGGGTVWVDAGHNTHLQPALLPARMPLTPSRRLGTGTLIVGGASTYLGATNLAAGTIMAATANALPTNTALTVSGTLDLGGFCTTSCERDG